MVDLLGTGLSGGITLIAAFGGIFVAGLNQRRVDERAGQREDAKHRREVSARLEEERRRDQLDLLRTVQEETLEATGTTMQLLSTIKDLRNEGGDDSALPDHLRPDHYAARTKLALHASRLLDDDIRASLAAFGVAITEASMYTSVIPDSGTVEEASVADLRRINAIDGQHQQIIDALGAAIRVEVARTYPHASGPSTDDQSDR